jgi:hypothetical protein
MKFSCAEHMQQPQVHQSLFRPGRGVEQVLPKFSPVHQQLIGDKLMLQIFLVWNKIVPIKQIN